MLMTASIITVHSINIASVCYKIVLTFQGLRLPSVLVLFYNGTANSMGTCLLHLQLFVDKLLSTS